MASSLMSSSAVTTVNRASSVQSGAVAPFVGLKSMAGFPVTKTNKDITSITSNGGRVNCMQVRKLMSTIWVYLSWANGNNLWHVHELFSTFFHKLFRITYNKKVWLYFIVCYRNNLYISTYRFIGKSTQVC